MTSNGKAGLRRPAHGPPPLRQNAALQALRPAAGAWDEFRLSAEEFFEDGDTVVVVGHSAVRKGGTTATASFVHIWRWHRGRIRQFQVVTHTRQLAQLTGRA